MAALFEKLYLRVTKYLPPDIAGRLDLARPSYRLSWGGPLNGQEARQQIIRDLAKAIPFDQVIETGAYRGTSTEFFSAIFGVPVATVEANPRFYLYSKRRLAAHRNVTVELGDSRPFLRDLAERPDRGEAVFVYLDAHWEDDLPLAEELQIIASAWSQAVVMIDDFQVPDDSGYSYDDYGVGKALVEDYLPEHVLTGWKMYYPAVASDRETGARRGSCVLVSPALSGRIVISTLRLARSF
jgi:hypothetical protein